MEIKINKLIHPFIAGILSSAMTFSHLSVAAPLDIADEPLFLGTQVDPNILIVIDDSGSMDLVQTMSNAAQTLDAREPFSKVIDENDEVVRELEELMDYTPDTAIEAFRLCPGFNVMAYDPTKTYTPWAGEDSSQNAYPSMTNLNSVRIDPYEDGNANNKNISSHVYTIWNDDGDDVFEAGECPNLGLGAHDYNTTVTCIRRENGRCTNSIDKINVTEGVYETSICDASSSCFRVNTLSPAEQENYGNWYSYYRKRDLVAKKAMLALADGATVRMGLGTLHDNDDVGLPIQDMKVNANKTDLMDKVSQIRPAGGTPARIALKNAGEYFTNGSDDLFDGRYRNLNSPILAEADGGACQKNFTVLMTDGYSKGGSPNVGNRDNDGGTGDDNTEFDGDEYADTLSDTMADVAMKYFEEDLSNLDDNVNVRIDGEAQTLHQHMITYTAAFGVNGNLTCDPGDPIDGGICQANWPTNINYIDGTDPATIDDLRHAAFNGRGEFLNAQTPEDLIDGLQDAISDITNGSSSAAVAANSTSLVSNTAVYQGVFDSGDWSGDLAALPVNNGSNPDIDDCSGLNIGEVCRNPLWEAADLLDQVSPNSRVIITSDANGAGIPFRWPENDTAPETADLVRALTANGTRSTDLAELTLNYVRGDRTFEDNPFRKRSTVLGDIIHSSPSFVGTPRFFYPDSLETANYSAFKATQSTRTKMVYVGANDGMLHGFDAETGAERLAYIPSSVFEGLPNFSDIDYDHQYFVDGSPTVGDVFFAGAWRTLLAGSLRAGGRSVFGLDITNPSGFSETNSDDIALWEFTDVDLGYTFSRPDIVKTQTGAWSVIFGSGYNKENADGSAGDNGVAHLFIVNAEDGSLIRKIAAGTEVAGLANGLATVTPVDVDSDFVVDYVYAGDLLGNLWRFDLTSATSTNWRAQKLFTASSPTTGSTQPITTRPSVAFHPEGLEGLLVMFGTGSYIENSDNSSTGQATQSFYAVWDKLEATISTRAILPSVDRSNGTNFVQQFISTDQNGLRVTTDNAIDWELYLGWYIDLAVAGASDNEGERQVTNSVIRGDRVVFTTLLPNTTVCESGGDSYLMELSTDNGGRPDQSPIDINNDGVINQSDLVGNNGDVVVTGYRIEGIVTEPTIIAGSDATVEHKVFSSSSGSTTSVLESAPNQVSGGKRQSWTEIVR